MARGSFTTAYAGESVGVKMEIFHPRSCFKPLISVFNQREPKWISLLNGTPRKLTSLIGTAPSLDVLAFIRTVTG